MADGEEVAQQAIGGIGGALGAIPFVGPLLSAGAAITSGILEKDAAKKQTAQGLNLQQQASRLQQEPVSPGFLQKLNFDQQAAADGLPGLQLYKNFMAQQTANHMSAIQRSSPNGASAVNAISAALYNDNEGLQKLGASDTEYRTTALSRVSDDLGTLGTQERGLQLWRDQERDRMLGQANALAAAGTGNNTNANNIITGAIGSTGSNIFKNLTDPNYLKGLGIGNGGVGKKAINTTADGYDNTMGYSGGYTPAAPTTGGADVATSGVGNPIWSLPFGGFNGAGLSGSGF